MPKLTWLETHWLAGTPLVLCLSTGRQRKAPLLPQPSFQSYTSSGEMQTVGACPGQNTLDSQIHTHTLLIAEGPFCPGPSPGTASAPCPEGTAEPLCKQRGWECPEPAQGEPGCVSRSQWTTWRVVALIPNLRHTLWGCKEAPPVPLAGTPRGKELSRSLLLYNGSVPFWHHGPVIKALIWHPASRAPPTPKPACSARLCPLKGFIQGRLESTTHFQCGGHQLDNPVSLQGGGIKCPHIAHERPKENSATCLPHLMPSTPWRKAMEQLQHL